MVVSGAEAVNEEIRDLFAAGADVVQIDDPWLQARSDRASRYGVKALNRALDEKAVGDNIRGQGYEVLVQTPAETGQFIRTEFAKWGKVVKDSGAKAD